MIRPPPTSPLFPYTPLSRSEPAVRHVKLEAPPAIAQNGRFGDGLVAMFLQTLLTEIADQAFMQDVVARDLRRAEAPVLGKDRKSTRLNSSHGYISYAVFCLK